MQQQVDTYLLQFCLNAGGLFLFAGLVVYLWYPAALGTFCIAYLLSFIFTGSNFLVMRKVGVDDQPKFIKIFGSSLIIRFLLILAALVFTLKALNNHQIFFTVSFIISYICHSINEIIFLNKILETDTKK